MFCGQQRGEIDWKQPTIQRFSFFCKPEWMGASVETLIIQAGNNCKKVSLLLWGLEARALGHYLSVENATGLWIVETVNSGINAMRKSSVRTVVLPFSLKKLRIPILPRTHTHTSSLRFQKRSCFVNAELPADGSLTWISPYIVYRSIQSISSHAFLGVEGRAITDNMWKGIFSACASLKARRICG